MDVEIIATARNAVGYDQPGRRYLNKRLQHQNFSGILMQNDQMDPKAQTTGTVCLASDDESCTPYMGWEHNHPCYERLLRENPIPEFDDTEGRNDTDKETGTVSASPVVLSAWPNPPACKTV